MKLGAQQKAAALAVAAGAIETPNLKRIGDRWAAIGYRKRTDAQQPGDPSHLWRGHLILSVHLMGNDDPRHAVGHVGTSNGWRVVYVVFTHRTRRELVASMEQYR